MTNYDLLARLTHSDPACVLTVEGFINVLRHCRLDVLWETREDGNIPFAHGVVAPHNKVNAENAIHYVEHIRKISDDDTWKAFLAIEDENIAAAESKRYRDPLSTVERAVLFGPADAVAYLFDNGGLDMLLDNHDGRLAWRFIVSLCLPKRGKTKRNLAVLQHLYDRGVLTKLCGTRRDRHERNLLHFAIEVESQQVRNDMDVTTVHRVRDAVIGNFPDLVNRPDRDGITPLHLAGMFGLEETFEKLISAGAKRRCKDGQGNVPRLTGVLSKKENDVAPLRPYFEKITFDDDDAPKQWPSRQQRDSFFDAWPVADLSPKKGHVKTTLAAKVEALQRSFEQRISAMMEEHQKNMLEIVLHHAESA